MAAQPQPEVSPWTGTLKTIGEYGPLYEVMGSAGHSTKGEALVTIRVVTTGEVTEYGLEDMLNDPEAV